LFGDLNFRVTLPNEVVRKNILAKEFKFLQGHDELKELF